MATHDPVWFWRANYTDGSVFTFWADSKDLAEDHAATVGFDIGKTVATVKRLGHSKDLTASDRAFAGKVFTGGVQVR